MSEWKAHRLGEHLEVLSGFPFDSVRFTNDGGMPLVRIRDLVNAHTDVNYGGPYSKEFVIKNGDLLIGMDGDFHVVRWKGGDALLNQRVLKVSERAQSGLDLLFSFYVLGPLMERVNNVTAATTVKHISTKDVVNAVIQAPNKDTQRTIARILGTIDALIEQTESLIEKQRQIKQGMLHDLFTRGVDANGQLRPPQHEAPELYKETKQGWVPKEWGVERMDTIGRLRGGKRLPKGMPFADGPTPHPYIRVVDMLDGTVSVDNLVFVTPAVQKFIAPYTIGHDDIYISIAGTIGLFGRIPIELDGAQLTENALKLCEVDLEKYNVDYLVEQFNAVEVQAQIWREIGTGGGVPKLAMHRVASTLSVIPKKTEQDAIAERLTVMNRSIKLEEGNRSKLVLIKAGLMRDLLTGRVPVDHLVESMNEQAATVASQN